jgi:RNA polymerase sigma-70 factor, ECF subfamily
VAEHEPASEASATPLREAERELVRRCVAGEPDAQRALLQRYGALVWPVCARALGATEAEDVFQETFWRVFRALPRFRGESRLSTWLYSIALRAITDHRRSPARRDQPSGLPSDPEFPEPPRSSASPERDVILSERRERVRQALDALDEPTRTVMQAYYLREMPVAAIATAMAMPEGTVKTHLHRGRQRLRDALGDLW